MIAFLLILITFTGMAQQKEYVLVIHGGAGDLTNSYQNQETRQKYYCALDSALMIGNNILEKGGESIRAVIAVVNYLENNPMFNAGKGATCTAGGTFELDASIMDGRDLSAGAVAGVKTIKNPITAALAVKNNSSHVILCGQGAEEFAKEQQLDLVDNSYFATPRTMKWVEELKAKSKKNGTVGCVALDKNGNLAAGTSTGGMFKKKWGRIGDSPVIGAGTYADNNTCAVSCTGHGEYYIRNVVAYDVTARMKYLNESVDKAAGYIINQKLSNEKGSGGLIAVDKDGNIAMPFNSSGMFRGYIIKEKNIPGIIKKVGICTELE